MSSLFSGNSADGNSQWFTIGSNDDEGIPLSKTGEYEVAIRIGGTATIKLQRDQQGTAVDYPSDLTGISASETKLLRCAQGTRLRAVQSGSSAADVDVDVSPLVI